MKKVASWFLVFSMILCLFGCGKRQQAADFGTKVEESKHLLDTVARAVLSNWHAAIYDDAFNDDIDEAIDAAVTEHTEDLQEIVRLNAEVIDLFKQVKDDKTYGDLCKDIMNAYEAYYDLVIKLNGSYNSFSEEYKQYEQDLTTALRQLSYEL